MCAVNLALWFNIRKTRKRKLKKRSKVITAQVKFARTPIQVVLVLQMHLVVGADITLGLLMAEKM
jgi:hypothetical protein